MKLKGFREDKVATGSILSGYADIEIGDSSALNTFEIQGVDENIKYIAVIDDEYGGVIERSCDGIEHKRTGFTWRGLLTKWMIEPVLPAGGNLLDDARFTVSGDINVIVHNIISGILGGFFSTNPEPLGINVDNYAFPLHCTVLEGLSGLCEAYGCRLDIKNKIENSSLKVVVSAKIIEHKILKETAFSSTITVDEMGINHLICFAEKRVEKTDEQKKAEEESGIISPENELIRRDIYLQPDGNITFEQHYAGFKERQATFEFGSYKDNETEFINAGIKRLTELAGFIKMDITHVSADARVGDYLFAKKGNMAVHQPVTRKILTFKNGIFAEEIKIKGQN